MNKRLFAVFAVLCGLMVCISAGRLQAQEPAKEKPPMYTYVANWVIPRAQWAEMGKENPGAEAVLQKALGDGTLVGYGSDFTEVHEAEGSTHDSWWSSMSMAGLLNVLNKFAIATPAPVLATATKHWDNIFVSRYYSWHSGSFKGAYTRGSMYTLKPDAPDDAVETLSKSLIVPMLDKLLADGAILEYEIDTEAVHTGNPANFWIVILTPNAEGLDKLDAALGQSIKANPLAGAAFVSMIDYAGHRDFLASSIGTYK